MARSQQAGELGGIRPAGAGILPAVYTTFGGESRYDRGERERAANRFDQAKRKANETRSAGYGSASLHCGGTGAPLIRQPLMLRRKPSATGLAEPAPADAQCLSPSHALVN